MIWRNLRFWKVIEKIPLAVIVTRPNGFIDYANSQAHVLLDVPDGWLSFRDVADFKLEIPPQGEGPKPAPAAPSPRWQDETRYSTGRGRQVWVLETLWPVHDAAGKVSCLVYFLQPMSARKS